MNNFVTKYRMYWFFCGTYCPFGCHCGVGSTGCTTKCTAFISQDKKKKTITCTGKGVLQG